MLTRSILQSLGLLLLLAACGRPLTPSETAFAKSLHGDALDTRKVRIVDGAPTRAVTLRRKARPRLTCRERILPPRKDEVITAKPAAVALFNTVMFDRDWYLDDYMPDYPDRLSLITAMLLAHELTHVWQWQNRKTTGFTPLRAAFEHDGARDPYLFDLETQTQFSDFGYEQQGALVEEYVCCRMLDPKATRTGRLHDLLAQAMPVSPLPRVRAHAVGLPWDGVTLKGICA